MLFIGVALLIAAGLALVIAGGAGGLVGLNETQTGQLVPLLVILIIIAGGAFSRRHRFGELVGNAVLWMGIFAIIAVGYAYRHDLSSIAQRVMGELSPGAAVVDTSAGTATFQRSLGGSFQIKAEVNGAELMMIFDTGATAVVLTQTDARAAGINTEALRYSVPVQTANGTGAAALVTLDSLIVGGIARRGIRGFVVEEEALDTSLLGMTFLETLDGYSVSRDALELRD